MIDCVLAHGCS